MRVVSILLFAFIGAVLALLDYFFLAGPHTAFVPESNAGLIGFYGIIIAPWALLGVLVGFFTSRRPKPKS